MPKITAIIAQKKNKSRVSIFVDGDFFIGLDSAAAMAARLRVGDEVDPDTLKKASEQSEINSAFDKAVRKLSIRPNSRREIKTYLADKGYDEDAITAAVDRLEEYGYINDRAFAESLIRSYGGRQGRLAVRARLKEAGVADAIINIVLDYSDAEGAKICAEKYLRTHEIDRRKLRNYLFTKGYTTEGITEALRELEINDDEEYDGI